MKNLFLSFILITFFLSSNAQVSTKYEVSFENLSQHEAVINATFTNLKSEEIEFRMSRSSPGRYALHEFAKNVYNVKVTDGNGKVLDAVRKDPYSWAVKNDTGILHVSYTLFGNHGDGTYAQIDETHAHLNMPATFMYVPDLFNQEVEVHFNVPENLNWKIATQLKNLNENTFYAKDFQYFMDSPVEISDYSIRSFDVDGQTINFVLHHNGTDAEFDTYFESVKKIVLQEKAVLGSLPNYDYGEYTFLACYTPNITGDGMEHRNSTVVTSTTSLANGGITQNLSTVSHEFFHCWNVERIRPKSLEPFDFSKANMSGELWFAEGFTNYYGDLAICRAEIKSQENFIKGLEGGFNYVWKSTGRQFFNPIEMSYQAPFVDAAKSVDPNNRRKTYISYYYYGQYLALALDLSLREQNLNLDDFMKLLWNNYGQNEIPYTNDDINKTLNSFAGGEFGTTFFNKYIYKSEMPDFESLFKTVGVVLTKNDSQYQLSLFEDLNINLDKKTKENRENWLGKK